MFIQPFFVNLQWMVAGLLCDHHCSLEVSIAPLSVQHPSVRGKIVQLLVDEATLPAHSALMSKPWCAGNIHKAGLCIPRFNTLATRSFCLHVSSICCLHSTGFVIFSQVQGSRICPYSEWRKIKNGKPDVPDLLWSLRNEKCFSHEKGW